MNPLYPFVAHRAGHRCEYCHAPEVAFNFPFEVDHIAPTASGGTVAEDNLALVCRSCNVYKSDNLFGRDPLDGAETRLFSPRLDVWDEHYAIELDSVFVGRTPTGRATIDQLRMNSQRQVAAPRQWRILGIFL